MYPAGDANHLIAFHHIALVAAQQTGVEHHAKAQFVGITVDDEKAHRFAIVSHPDKAMQLTVPELFNRQMDTAVAGQRHRDRLRKLRRLRSDVVPPQLSGNHHYGAAEGDQPKP